MSVFLLYDIIGLGGSMKKVLIVLICLLLLVGCNKESKKDNVDKDNEETFVIEKIDTTKDYVYFSKYKEVNMSSGVYTYQYPIINIKSEEIENLNLELKNFVIRSYKDAGIYEEYLNSGNVVNYQYYMTEEYISIIQSSYYYIDGMVGEYSDKVYVVSLNNGKIISNKTILDNHGISENDLYKMVEQKVDSDDVAFALMNIKENGYYLYVNNEDKLGIIFYEVTDEEEIRKELVLN